MRGVRLSILAILVMCATACAPSSMDAVGQTKQRLEGPACVEHHIGAPASVRWKDLVVGVREAHEDLHAVLTNNTEEELVVRIGARAGGLDGRVVRIEIGEVHLAPNEETELSVRPEQFPVQSVRVTSSVILEADVLGPNEDVTVTVPSTALHYAFDDKYSTVTFFGDVPDRWDIPEEAPYEEVVDHLTHSADKLFDVVGRVWVPATDSFVFVEELRSQTDAVVQDQTTYLQQWWEFPRPNNYIDSDPPPGPDQANICLRWEASYVDTDFGETAWPLSKARLGVPARYAWIQLIDFGATPFPATWSGQLDGNGCRRLQLAPNKQYFVLFAPTLRTATPSGGSTDVDVFYEEIDSKKKAFLGLTGVHTKATSWTTPYTLVANFPHGDEVTAAATIAGLAMKMPDNGLQAGSYPIHAKEPCPGVGGGSCADGTGLFLGTDAAGGSDAHWKHVVGHEFGHMVQDHLSGLFGPRSYESTTTDLLCGCDHVNPDLGRSHCLQSREPDGDAHIEGFGHFYASRIFNTQNSTAACRFVYYKEFKRADGVVQRPPFTVDCREKVRWMENHCLAAQQGVEWDWMNFLYSINTAQTSSPNKRATLSDLSEIYRFACTGTATGRCQGFSVVHWNDFVDGALSHFGSVTDERYIRINDDGGFYGVDH